MTDLHTLKRPLAIRFTKKNPIHPFDSAASLEFFSEKNDAALLVFGSHQKKRPHALTFVRTFEHKTLDMLELLVQPETLRTLSQFKNERKATVGLKPMVCFAGRAFESPVPDAYTLAKSVLLDFFKGPDVPSVDVEGLQYLIQIAAGEEGDKPLIHVRSYMIRTKRSGQKLPRVEVEEMGPRIDFAVGRIKEAEEAVMKEALKTPKAGEPKKKKNVETDIMGDKVGRIHVGKQSLDTLQTRKMKGLKRSRGGDGDVEMDGTATTIVADADEGVKRARV